ncbi:hypothetical protein ACHHYP_13178 [Achlya hypogyna]|uniref:Transmembrane protein n=1 Tax=Achlya hypogyna TaxID=1202772 RepID=A0A1V9YFR5_ACHHY|nr:hypothetical protein ACHHYP_13178 [Achlya hypogyna]
MTNTTTFPTGPCQKALDGALGTLSSLPWFSSCPFLSKLQRSTVDLTLLISDCRSPLCMTYLSTGFLGSRFDGCTLGDGNSTLALSDLNSICFYPSRLEALAHPPVTKPPPTTTPPPSTTTLPTTASPLVTASLLPNATIPASLSSTEEVSDTTGMTVGFVLVAIAALVCLALFFLCRKRAHSKRAPPSSNAIRTRDDDDDDDEDDVEWSEECQRFLPVFLRGVQVICAAVALTARSGAFPTVTLPSGESLHIGGGLWTLLSVLLVIVLLEGVITTAFTYRRIAATPPRASEDERWEPLSMDAKLSPLADAVLSLAGLVVAVATAASDRNTTCGEMLLVRCGSLRTSIGFTFLTVFVLWGIIAQWLLSMDADERAFHAGWRNSRSSASSREAPPGNYAEQTL